MSIIIFIIILLILVLVHEAGHFFVAKKFGIRVDEFGFGFPPKLFGIKKGETEYTFNALPLGGFVKIYGQDPDEENTNGPDSKRSFVNKPRWQQALVLFAGIFANFILAWFLIIGLYTFGTSIIFDETLPTKDMQNTQLVIASVSSGTPAEKANLQSGDIISGMSYFDQSDSLSSNTPKKMTTFVRKSEGKTINFNIIRNNTPIIVTVTPLKQNENYVVGISPTLEGYIKLRFPSAVIQGFHSTFVLVKETFQGIGGLLVGKESFNDVSGPVGMVGIVGSAMKMGFQYVIVFVALISINLAVINLIPFPALDGGRLFFLLIEKIKGSRMNPKFANTANMVGFAILILLMVFVTYHDVVKLF